MRSREPLLPFDAAAAYAARVHAVPKIERGKSSPLPQWLADRTGWESFIRDMRRVVRSVTPAERAQALIYVPDYGHAGAIELWGPRFRLPPVISPDNSYYHWSADRTDSAVLIAVDVSPALLRRAFRDVQPAGDVDCTYCMSWRSHMPIFVARGPVRPLRAFWRRLKHYE